MEGQELAARHIALRERAGLTQEQEAKMAGVSPTTISGIESGKITRPHLRTLLKIARALGADVGELRESGKGVAPPSLTQPALNGFEEERRAEVKGPDESVWGAPQNRPGPGEDMPEPAGRRIHVEIRDDLSTEPARVEITYEPFLDVLRRYGLTRRAAEEAFEELRRKSA